VGRVDMALHTDSALGQWRPDGRLHVTTRIWLPIDGLIDTSESDATPAAGIDLLRADHRSTMTLMSGFPR
jgi:hypothetical protein